MGLLRTLLFSLLFMQTTNIQAASDADTDRLTTYTTLLGRAMACEIDTTFAHQSVTRWVERAWSHNVALGKILLQTGIVIGFRGQSTGTSPDSCEKMRAIYPTLVWPNEPVRPSAEPTRNSKQAIRDDVPYIDPEKLKGWWVIVASIPETDTTRMGDDFIRFTAAGRRCGYTVFNDFSWKFEGFAPGYNVFVIGAYQSSSQATEVASAVGKCLPGAYVKYGRYLGE